MKAPLELVRTYHTYTKPKQSVYLVLFLLILCGVAADLVIPVLSKVLFDFAYVRKDLGVLNLITLGWAGFIGITFVLRSSYDLLILHTGQAITIRLRNAVFSRIQNLQVKALATHARGDLIVRITDDVDRCQDTLLERRFDLFNQLLQIGSILAICFWINHQAAFIVALSLPFYVLIPRYLFKKELGIVRDRLVEQKSHIIEFLENEIRQISVVKAFRQEANEELHFQEHLRTQTGLRFRDKILRTIFAFNTEFAFDLWTLFVTWYLGYRVIQNALTIGDTVSLVLLFRQIRGPTQGLSQQFGRFRNSVASLRRVDEVMTAPLETAIAHTDPSHPPVLASSSAATSLLQAGNIEIRNLSFSYSPQRTLLKNLNLSIPSSSYVAIVGENGSGKSTLIQLLLHYLEPTTGTISIGGKDYHSFSLEELRASVVDVSHKHGIFPGTLQDIITYGKKSASLEEVTSAAKKAAVWDFIQHQPQGLSTLIQHEDELSLGLRQRLAIARALVLEPKVLILDEVTTALDAITEFYLQEAIREMSRSKTVIVIAQKASTLKNVDSILFLKDGEITEQGSFDELLEKKGDFFRYYSSQFGGFNELIRMLDHEMHRCARHFSSFSIAAYRITDFHQLTASLTPSGRTQFISAVEFAWAKVVRKGDSSAAFRDGIFFVLLPELKNDKLPLFLARMQAQMVSKTYEIEGQKLTPEYTWTTRTFTKPEDLPKTSELLIRSLTEREPANATPSQAA